MSILNAFPEVLQKYRDFSFSERDKGARFERLIQRFLRVDPVYQGKFKHIWLWNEFPYRADFGGKDTGIDLVCGTVEGDFWAVQCKCWEESAYIDKPAVDSFLATSSKTFKNGELQTTRFAQRLWVSTTNRWNAEAENAIENQSPPVTRITLADLEAAPVDWATLDEGKKTSVRLPKKTPRDHQIKAIDKAHAYYEKGNDRGKLIMACGTGKTFTALKIAERETAAEKGKGLILFLVPSIALIAQTLKEWAQEATHPIYPICVCSDSEVGREKTSAKNGGDDDTDSFSVVDLGLPASTNEKALFQQLEQAEQNHEHLTVIFSTYQSIDVVSRALKKYVHANHDPHAPLIDLIICDEAHRTTGMTFKDEAESAFVRVHDNAYLPAVRRLYMTATPRIYDLDTETRRKAAAAQTTLYSMDDPALYGEEIYRIGFGEAVNKGLLSDYKVLVLTLSENEIPESFRSKDNTHEGISTDDASKLVGVINAMSKRLLLNADLIQATDPNPMKKAVAFCPKIKVSKQFKEVFNDYKDRYREAFTEAERATMVNIKADHIDGGMGASQREEKLLWLKAAPKEGNEARILCNVRCLSEGVDVPSLDAVIYLSAKNSQIDVVQSVGRVMRVAEGKKYGYIIIPVFVSASEKAEDALDKNDRYKVVWTILNALRAHDDRFTATINQITLNKNPPQNILCDRVPSIGGADKSFDAQDRQDQQTQERVQRQFSFEMAQGFSQAIYARMVEKVGDKRYWEQWAKDVATIADNFIARINGLIRKKGKHQEAFDAFLEGMRKNINPAVNEGEVVEMLAQHLITKPIFEALFEGYSFVSENPVSQSLQKMIDLLEGEALEKDAITLTRFYESVKIRVKGIDNAAGKQKAMVELYDKFFKTAFPKTVEKLGIVYTPIEIVDFINRSVADILKQEFDRTLSDKNVHILDPFTGTGTFISRMIQSGLIDTKSLSRKYQSELHANEIVLLAYYIASVNIENAYHDVIQSKTYEPFAGICLTDTFQLGETDDQFSALHPENSERVKKQKNAPITVIVGNPPYSVGQKSANDNAQNQKYEKLEARIAETYSKGSTATNVKSLSDSYIKAFRWATDRVGECDGVVAFVTNAGWIDGNAMDGFRKCLEAEFSAAYVFNLRGAIRGKIGETAKKEGKGVFNIMTGVAITVLVKRKDYVGKAKIHYCDIGDYLTREDKLKIITQNQSALNPEMAWQVLNPNEHGDWINPRNDLFSTYIPLGDKDDKNNRQTVFVPVYSMGLTTNRDTWCYHDSKKALTANIKKTVDFYNAEVKRLEQARKKNPSLQAEDFVERDSTKISWTRAFRNDADQLREKAIRKEGFQEAIYRPFYKRNVYFDKSLNEMTYQIPKLFPTPKQENLVICCSGVGVTKEFSCIISDTLPDLEVIGKSQCFPLYYYEESGNAKGTQGGLFDTGGEKYIKRDAVTDFILKRCREEYGERVKKEDIFYYVYGLLHSPDYRAAFSSDLKKMLPRLPLVEKPSDFWAFSKAGRELAEIHLNYESAKPPKAVTVEGRKSQNYTVEKMRFYDKADKSVIAYNGAITISNIPLEAYEYVVNGRPAIEWVMEQYRVKTDADSGITNNPNDWAAEHNQPAYILDLLLSVITVSLDTITIVKTLPPMPAITQGNLDLYERKTP